MALKYQFYNKILKVVHLTDVPKRPKLVDKNGLQGI